eukprot:2031554-Rhodomonas_salina.1
MMIDEHHEHKHEALTEDENTKGHQQVETTLMLEARIRHSLIDLRQHSCPKLGLDTCSSTRDNTRTRSSDSTLRLDTCSST